MTVHPTTDDTSTSSDERRGEATGSAGAHAERIRLVKPAEAEAIVAEVFADIRKHKGDHFLTPTWGFFAHDPELLQLWWELQKRLFKKPGHLPKHVLLGINFVVASEINCPRCINNAQVHLQEQHGMTDDEVFELSAFEDSEIIPDNEKAVYRFCKKMAFDLPTTEADFAALRDAGYSDAAIVEMISVTILEAGFIRRARAVAPFEDGHLWPREHLPSVTYAGSVDSTAGRK